VAAIALAMTVVVVLSSLGGSVVWSKTITAPFTGSFKPTTPTYINYSSSGPSFNFTTGNGSYDVVAWGGSAGSSDVVDYGYFTRVYGQSPYGNINFDIPFKNHSGTRILSHVNISISYSIAANYSFTPGTCPWIKSTKKPSECYSAVQAGAWITGAGLGHLNGRNPFSSYVSCSSGCTRSTQVFYGVYDYEDEKNSSKGPTYSNSSSPTSSVNVTGSVTYAITPVTPLRHSGTLVLSIGEEFVDEVEFQSKASGSRLLGGFGYVSLSYSIDSISIAES
jgi:hypothetical protein